MLALRQPQPRPNPLAIETIHNLLDHMTESEVPPQKAWDLLITTILYQPLDDGLVISAEDLVAYAGLMAHKNNDPFNAEAFRAYIDRLRQPALPPSAPRKALPSPETPQPQPGTSQPKVAAKPAQPQHHPQPAQPTQPEPLRVVKGGLLNLEEQARRIKQVYDQAGIHVEFVGQPIAGPRLNIFRLRTDKDVANLLKHTRNLVHRAEIPPGFIAEECPGYVEFQVPRKSWTPIAFDELVKPSKLSKPTDPFKLLLGLNPDGSPRYEHLDCAAIGGTRRNGKTTLAHSFLLQILRTYNPKFFKILILDDPIKRELRCYEGVPHLWGGMIASHPYEVRDALFEVVKEIEDIHKQFHELSRFCHTLDDYNAHKEIGLKHAIPRVLIYMAEIAEVLEQAQALKKPCDEQINRYLGTIARVSGASGRHFMGDTQRWALNIIDAQVRTNLGHRFAFCCPENDSKIILGDSSAAGGAAAYLQMGECIWRHGSDRARLQVPYIDSATLQEAIEAAINQWGESEQTFFANFDEEVEIELPKTARTKEIISFLSNLPTGDEVEDESIPLYVEPNSMAEFCQERYELLTMAKQELANSDEYTESQLMRDVWGDLYDDPSKACLGRELGRNRKRNAKLELEFK